MKKKILFITHQLTRTGAPNVLLDMIKCCRKQGAATVVISLSDGPVRTEWQAAGIELSVIPGLSLMGNQIVEIMSRFDAIVVNTLVCCEVIPLCVQSGTETIWWIHEHENYFEYYKAVLPKWKDIKGKVRVYGVSPVTVRLLKEMAGYSDAELLTFCVPETEEKSGHKDGGTVSFVCIGVYAYVKGQDVLCKAIKELKADIREKCMFMFYGDRTVVDSTVYLPVEEAEREMECVKCFDSIPHDEMLKVIAKSDYVIIPSRKEPMPTVAVEAMMLRTPCIISDICGVADFLKDGESAIFFESENAGMLSSCIERAAEKAETNLYESIAEEANKVYRKWFGKQAFQSQIKEIFESPKTRIVLCHCSKEAPMMQKCFDILEKEMQTVEIVGNIVLESADEEYEIMSIETLDGIPIDSLGYDYILVLGDDRVNRSQAIRFLQIELGINREIILPDRVVCLSGFSTERYQTLVKSDISIISNNCAGGMLYHLLGLPFMSPTVNMFQMNDSFLRFSADLYGHLSKPLVFDHMEKEAEKEYPVFTIGDAVVHMNHYKDPEAASAIWYKRLGRLNPDNVLIMMYTEDKGEVAAFHYLPFKKKVCFVPFPCELPEVYPIPPSIDKNAKFWQLVLAVADGTLECYDLFDMLIDGKKTQIMPF